jgi:hypothetical protein
LEAKYCERRWIKNEDSLLEREGNDMVAPKRLQKNWTEAIIILLIWISSRHRFFSNGLFEKNR